MAEMILVVDDDDRFRERLALALRDRGFEGVEAGGYEAAMAAARAGGVSRAILDLKMPGRGGLELLRDLLALAPGVRAVVLTGYGSIATAVEAVRLGAINYLAKPAHAEAILAAFERGQAPPLTPLEADYQATSLARAEWEHIQRVLADCGGNISQAARILGLHRRTLQRKLQKYPPRN